MNVNMNLQSYSNKYKTEKTIFKFISTLDSLNIIKKSSSQNQLKSGLKQRRIVLDLNSETYKKIVYPKLGITSHTSAEGVEMKQSIALQYAKILKQYDPSNSGELNVYFNYLELVSVIKKVFKYHMRGKDPIFSSGIAVSIKNNTFYAKVNANKICIFPVNGNFIGKGASGYVYRVLEIASCQFMALKLANPKNFYAADFIRLEIANLIKVQQFLIEGIQEPFVADFNLQKKNLVGYIGPLYDMDLIEWLENPSLTQQIRISFCKSLMRIFMHMDNLGLWHGDIKPENIMLKENHPIVIDWAGFLLYEEAADRFIKPIFSTASYLNRKDLLTLHSLQAKKKPELKSKFIKSAKSLELFSIAITLFRILTSKSPFKEAIDPDLDYIIPQTTSWFEIFSLVDFKYSIDILNIMTKMLAHDPKDRYLIKEAYAAWEKIEE